MFLAFLLYVTALALTSTAGYFSVVGLTTIFGGAKLSVAILGSVLEAAKLVAASFVHRAWTRVGRFMRYYLVGAVLVLSCITSIGVFGYLSRAHVTAQAGLAASREQVTLLDGQIKTVEEQLTGYRTSLGQIDGVVSGSLAKNVTAALRRKASLKAERDGVTVQRDSAQALLARLRTQRSQASLVQEKVAAEVGPIRFVAELLYHDESSAAVDRAVRILIILIILVFDPLAILLVVAGGLQQRWAREVKPSPADLTTLDDGAIILDASHIHRLTTETDAHSTNPSSLGSHDRVVQEPLRNDGYPTRHPQDADPSLHGQAAEGEAEAADV